MNPLLHEGAVSRYDVGVTEQSKTQQAVIRDLTSAGDLPAYETLPTRRTTTYQSLVEHQLVLVVQLPPGVPHTHT